MGDMLILALLLIVPPLEALLDVVTELSYFAGLLRSAGLVVHLWLGIL